MELFQRNTIVLLLLTLFLPSSLPVTNSAPSLTQSSPASKYQKECTMCSACDNPCSHSPPPPQSPSHPAYSYSSPPPPPPPPYYGGGGVGYYYYPPPPNYQNYPTPPPPNPIVPYFPFFYHSPPPPSSFSSSSAPNPLDKKLSFILQCCGGFALILFALK